MRVLTIVSLAALGLSSSARADSTVGKISVLDGAASRYPDSDKLDALVPTSAVALKTGDAVLLHDVIDLTKGYAKITLNDASVIDLGQSTDGSAAGARLAITEGDFQGQVRNGFGANLLWGKVWSHVTKALSGSSSKFEVTTPRAVAGVRGTIFRVDAVQIVTATRTSRKTRVRVDEGRVGVDAKVKPSAGGTKATAADKGPRHEVAGPTEVSKEEWEKLFIDLQKGMEVTVDDSPRPKATKASSAKDEFDHWVDQHP
jgi:hypothetical protein